MAKPLTIDKWERSSPYPDDYFGMIQEEFPTGIKGSFGTIKGNVQRVTRFVRFVRKNQTIVKKSVSSILFQEAQILLELQL